MATSRGTLTEVEATRVATSRGTLTEVDTPGRNTLGEGHDTRPHEASVQARGLGRGKPSRGVVPSRVPVVCHHPGGRTRMTRRAGPGSLGGQDPDDSAGRTRTSSHTPSTRTSRGSSSCSDPDELPNPSTKHEVWEIVLLVELLPPTRVAASATVSSGGNGNLLAIVDLSVADLLPVSCLSRRWSERRRNEIRAAGSERRQRPADT